jgi:hypothetical protein
VVAVIPFATYIAIRFADAFLALCVCVLIFLLNALLVMKLGTIGKLILPFEAILVSLCLLQAD